MARLAADGSISQLMLQRRTLLKAFGAVGVAGAATTLAACTGSSDASEPTTSTTATNTSGPITAAGVDRGLAALPGIIQRAMDATGVPGLAAAVVYDGTVRYAAGSGVRAMGKPEKVDADTVFYLASLSKPISSTVIGAAMTRKLADASWNDAIADHLPGFTLSDPWVGSHATIADMFSHRSGLPDHAGNLLEDLGFSRTEVISKLAAYPLGPFRDNYEYTNYGLTAGAEAFATATGRPWAALGEQVIFEPLGMTSTSYAYADLLTRQNRVALHRNVDGAFQAGPDADYEPQAPAGSASSSVRDMAKWMTMLLAGGAYDGAAVVDPDQLNAIWSPAFPSRAPTQVGAWAGFYGFGWNVKYEPTGDLQVSHSGAFGRGSATAVTLYPTEELGIVVLTNAPPQGVPEAISAEFVDIVRYGHSTQASWLDFIAPFLEQPATADQTKYSGPVAQAAPSRDLTAYAGVYQNSFYGPLTVSVANGGLALAAGPNAEQHGLTHYSGDEFLFDTTGEDASGLSGAVFTASVSGISSVTVNAWNHEGLGTFARR